MKNLIIGRAEEIKVLQSLLSSSSPEFLAIYGLRRVGKTFLIKQFFQTKKVKFFSITGEKNATMREQIIHFTKQISHLFYNDVVLEPKKNWDETFELLTKSIQLLNAKEKIILFFDEFPWMVTQHSRLLQNLDYYWNQHWSNDNRIKLIICGSSASWIIDNIVNNKGGLHNRLTRNILLEPYDLAETKQFLESLKKILGDNLFLIAVKKKTIRSGKGKLRGRRYKSNAGLLIVIGKNEKLKANNFDVAQAKTLNTTDLAGGGLGRLTAYTEQAVKELEERLK